MKYSNIRKMKQLLKDFETILNDENMNIEYEHELKQKEEELKVREKYLRTKMEKLNQMEQEIVKKEIEIKEKDTVNELKQNKIKTGTPRLDDLLYGGFPTGSSIGLYAPSFVGADVLMYSFVAEGLKKGIPSIVIIDKNNIDKFRENMKFILPSYMKYEKHPLVYYIPFTSEQILIDKEFEIISNNIRVSHKYYRMVLFDNMDLSTWLGFDKYEKLLYYLSTKIRKHDSVMMMHILKGVYSDSEYAIIADLITGIIDFKIENLKNYLAIRGICDVQSRAWIRYTFSKSGVDIGSFSLNKIR